MNLAEKTLGSYLGICLPFCKSSNKIGSSPSILGNHSYDLRIVLNLLYFLRSLLFLCFYLFLLLLITKLYHLYEMNTKEIKLQSEKNRKRLLEVAFSAQAAHLGGGLSSMNILTALYFNILCINPSNPKDPTRDRFVMSKGHCAESLYVTLESRGFFPREWTDSLGKFGSILAGHPTIDVPGIEVNTGSLGHGLSVGVGMALAAKMNQEKHKIFVLMGDGEQGEGSIYEAAMAANHYRLDNLIAIIDRNGLQISGPTEDVMSLNSIHQRWTALGWDVYEMNGDHIEEILSTYSKVNCSNKKPHLLIAHTTKGKGVSFMEHVAEWHHKIPSKEQYQLAIEEIDRRIKHIEEDLDENM